MAKRPRGKKEQPIGNDQSTLGEHVRRELRQAIESGRYTPSERIRESEILTWLGVSRTPVREAMHRLEAEGLLVFVRGHGFVVAELNRRQVLEFYEVRSTLESEAARHAAQHISPLEIEILEDILDQAYRNLDAPETLAKLDRMFHDTIYEASHNRYLMQTLTSLRAVLGLLRGTVYQLEKRAQIALEEHRAIVDGIKGGDQEAAYEAARRHMAGAQQARLRMMQDEQSSN